MDVETAPAERPVRSAPRLDEIGKFVGEDPELRAGRADGECRRSFGGDGRIEADEDVGADPGAPRQPRQGARLVGRLEGDPQERPPVARGPHRRGQVPFGLADPRERDPVLGEPRRAGRVPLPQGDGVGPKALRRRLPDERRQAVRLERIEAEPRVGEGVADRPRVVAEPSQVVEVEGRPEAPRRLPRRGGPRPGIGGVGQTRTPSTFFWPSARASTVETRLITSEPRKAVVRTSIEKSPFGQPSTEKPSSS